jgi:hypothetical protein
MKINHQILGVLLFIGILVLIFLLNNNINNGETQKQDLKEGFENQLDNYDILDNSFFDLSVTPWNDINLEEALEKCSKISSCIGITRKKKLNNNNTPSPDEDTENTLTYPILKIGTCYTKFMGGPLEKSRAQFYKSYLKKNMVGANVCLNERNIENYFSFITKNNLYWCVNDNDKTLKLLNASRIGQSKIFSKAKFKIVPGFFSNGSISIQVSKISSSTDNNEPTYYIVNDYPKQETLFVREIGENESDWKKRASFKMIQGLSKEGLSLKIIGLDDIYFKYDGDSMKVGTIEDAEKDIATFFTTTAISEENVSISQNELDSSSTNEVNQKIIDLSPQEKFLKMKNKNLLSLDKQQMMLEEQNKKINNYQYVHAGNIGRISREFANQSAELALSKYLKEKETIDDLLNKNKGKVIDNSPSVSQLKK